MKRICIILFVITLFISCEKIKDENEKYLGQYEWNYSSYHLHGSSGDFTNFKDANSITDRYAILIGKRVVYFYKNGKKIQSNIITKITNDNDKMLIGIHKETLFVYDNLMFLQDRDLYIFGLLK